MSEAEERERYRYLQLKAKASAAAPAPAAMVAPDPDAPGLAESFLRGGGQGVTLGLGDEVNAVIQAAGAKLFQGEDKSFGDLYRMNRDTFRRENDAAQRANPKAYLGGNVLGGAVLTPAMPGGAATTLGRVAKVGTAAGAVGGLGSSRADLTKGELLRAALDTAGGAAAGAVGSTVGYGVGKALPLVTRAVKNGLESVAERTGRRALLGGADSISGRAEVPRAAVLEAIRSGGILPGGTSKGAFGRLSAKTEALGSVYGEILEELEKAGVRGADAEAVINEMLTRAGQKFGSSGADKTATNTLMREAANVEGLAGGPGGSLGLRQAEEIKRDLANRARHEFLRRGTKDKALGEAAGIIREANESAVTQAGQNAAPNSPTALAAEAFVPVKQRLSRLIPARDAAERGMTANGRRAAISLKDAAMATATGGGLPQMVGGALIKGRIPSTVASSSYYAAQLADLLSKTATRLPERSAVGGALGSAALRAEYPKLSPEIAALLRALEGGQP